MFKKIALALSAAAMVAIPAAADAQGYYGGYGYSSYPAYGYGYGYPAYGYGSQSYGYPAYGYNYGYGYPSYYGSGGYGYNGYGYNGYGYNGYCRNNTVTGAAVGGIAGAILGSSVAEGGHHYYSRSYGRYRYDRSEKGV